MIYQYFGQFRISISIFTEYTQNIIYQFTNHIYLRNTNTSVSLEFIIGNLYRPWLIPGISSGYQLYSGAGVGRHFSEFSDKIFFITVEGLKPATSCVTDQDATTVLARHMWDTGSLHSAQFMLQCFIRFPEFNKSSAPFKKKSIAQCSWRKQVAI